jgi:hypothetical protein
MAAKFGSACVQPREKWYRSRQAQLHDLRAFFETRKDFGSGAFEAGKKHTVDHSADPHPKHAGVRGGRREPTEIFVLVTTIARSARA